MSLNFIKDKNIKVHFIGIGGISMSGLAAILLDKGYRVSGSDSRDSKIIRKLQESGAEIFIGHRKENIKDAGLVVYTAAIGSDNPEIIEAKMRKVQLMNRAEFLGKLMKNHKYNVAVAGTHGKTTSTSILSHIILEEKLDPTILVGGEVDILGGNYRIGSSEYLLTEACEYKRSFLSLSSYIGVILNIDSDHLDYYKDIDDIYSAFKDFAESIEDDGYLVGYAEDIRVKKIMDEVKCNTMSYGLECGDIRAQNIVYDQVGCASFDVYNYGQKLFAVSLSVPGKHNILNALASICTALILDISYEGIVSGLESYKGVHKRFEYKGKAGGVTVIDDYAHHPTEIKATLSTAAKLEHRKIYCVFQPHTYSRTITLFDEFTKAFDIADEVILMDIYAAREKDMGIVSSEMLGDAIRRRNIRCINVHSHDEAADYLKAKAVSGDLILTVGAGDVAIVGEKLLK